MLNFFNKVYIDLGSRFTSKADYLAISTNTEPHPVSKYLKQDYGESPSFKDYISTEHAESEDNFWKYLISIEQDRPFIIYTDPELFNYLFITFLKNIFQDATTEDLFQLYNFYRNNEIVKSNSIELRGGEYFKVDTAHFPDYSQEDFNDFIKTCPQISSLYSLDKSNVCFEFLFLQYLIDRDSYYSPYFLMRIKELAWSQWKNDVDELKNDIISSLYQIDQFDSTIDFNAPEDVNKVFNNSSLQWITDTKIQSASSKYFITNYKPEDFSKLMIAKDSVEFSARTGMSGSLKSNYEKKLELLFNEKYEELLIFDANTSLGCSFTKGNMQKKTNCLLISYFYSILINNNISFGKSLILSEKKLSNND